MGYAVGETLVCETLEEARDLCFTRNEKVKVVTLRGHSISKSGAMTGGSTGGERVDRWEEKEVDSLRRRKAELEGLLAQLASQAPSRQQLLDIETRLRSLQSKVKLNETDIKVVEEKLAHLQQQKALRGDNRARVKQELESVSGEIRALERSLAEVSMPSAARFCALIDNLLGEVCVFPSAGSCSLLAKHFVDQPHLLTCDTLYVLIAVLYTFAM